MPPDNTPNATQPSTPPRRTPSLSSHLYLQQLEEALSTPVPDLASTLATPESRPRSLRPAPAAWDRQPTTMENRSLDDSGREEPMASRESDLAASLDRMQSELDRWQTERNRLRTFLHNQQNRQSILEQQNSRLREEHSRLVHEHSRLSSSIIGASTSPPADPSPANQEQSTLSSLASTIAEVGRDNYATSGAPPQRQRLYDWATAPARPSQQESNNDTASEVVDPRRARHRELDRALRNYRMARNALRSDRPSSTDMGTVPNASALRAYWSEESHEEPRPQPGHPVFALTQLVDDYRRERQRRADQDPNSDEAVYLRRYGRMNPSSNTFRPSSTSDTSAKIRVRNTIRFLSKLRSTPASSTLELARSLDLDTLYESNDARTSLPCDLPLLVDRLPMPQYSSWLVPGMTWHGLQSTDRESGIAASSSSARQHGSTLPAAVLRRMRRDDYIGRAMARRNMADVQAVAEEMMERERTRDWARSEREREFEQPEGPHVGSGLDTERYISDFMRDTDGRWGFREGRGGEEGLPLPPPLAGAGATATDHWPVAVTIHGVDWDEMEVTGTMRASQIPDHRTTVPGEGREGGGRSMESFFKGEIIDFRRHTLETEGKRRGYKDGGVDVDARYWARVGPFKEAISMGGPMGGYASGKMSGGGGLGTGPLFAGSSGPPGSEGDGVSGDTWVERSWMTDEEKLKQLMAEDAASSSSGAPGLWSKSLTEREKKEEKEREADRVMGRCVGSQLWLREKVGREWILMRWKETCFVDPIKRASSSPPSSDTSNNTSSATTSTTSFSATQLSSAAAQATWGLTISGFYYIALHRQTGRIEGLYYDPGSQPFQRLGMMPEGCGGGGATTGKEKNGAVEGEEGRKWLNGDDDGDGGVDQKRNGTVPVKKWFPSLEFR